MSRLPTGATIGVVGGGQLARMMAMEARRLGLRTAILDPVAGGPAAQVADVSIDGALDDADAIARLAAVSDVLTLDTEHVPATVLAPIEGSVPVRPSSKEMATVQDRFEQRRFLAGIGMPQTANAGVASREELERAVERVGVPAVLKTRRSGYDGKGQARISDRSGLDDAWSAVSGAPCVLEAFVDYSRELSVVLARDLAGNIAFYPVAENLHRNHILHLTRAPAHLSPELEKSAREIGAAIAGALEHVGVLAVELFETRGGELLVNEIAPRTHNSGHFTFGACETSQFEQHVRAVAGWELGDPTQHSGAAMVNLLGDLWARGEPDWAPVEQCDGAKLHLYGKSEARPGRKMGHFLVLDGDVDAAVRRANELMERLESSVRGAG